MIDQGTICISKGCYQTVVRVLINYTVERVPHVTFDHPHSPPQSLPLDVFKQQYEPLTYNQMWEVLRKHF